MQINQQQIAAVVTAEAFNFLAQLHNVSADQLAVALVNGDEKLRAQLQTLINVGIAAAM